MKDTPMTTSDEARALKPCPFCGGEAKLVSATSSTVQCQNDQCIIGDPAPFNDFSHRHDAIAAWNTRAPLASTSTPEGEGTRAVSEERAREVLADAMCEAGENYSPLEATMVKHGAAIGHVEIDTAIAAMLALSTEAAAPVGGICPTCGGDSPDDLDCLTCARWWAANPPPAAPTPPAREGSPPPLDDAHNEAIYHALTLSGSTPSPAPVSESGSAIEALKLARPIVETDLSTAKEYNDSDWEGMTRTALEAIDAALTTPNPPASEAGSGEVERLREALGRCKRVADMAIERSLQRADGRGLNDAKKTHREISAIVNGALVQQPAGDGWQHMDAAPKDGTPILAWVWSALASSSYGWADTIRWWNGMWWDDRDGPCEPVAWMPRPPAPARAALAHSPEVGK